MEKRFEELMNLNPSFRVEISATIFSALQALDDKGKQVEMMEISATNDYSGINEMHLFKDVDGRVISLQSKDVRWGDGVEYASSPLEEQKVEEDESSVVLFGDDCKLNPACHQCQEGHGCDLHSDIKSKRRTDEGMEHIPSTTQSMLDLISAELQSANQGKLILVATNPRVYADFNVMKQAACIQNHFRQKGQDAAVLVATGRGMEFRLPGWISGRFIRRKLKTVSEVIEQVDKLVGLKTPMMIFGYSRMCRCVSFRSNERVPTAIILNRGPGYSLEDYIQAIGRATFNGLSVLKKNGHDQVTILTNENDFLAAKKYYVFVQEMNRLLKDVPGISTADAFRGAAKKFPDEANFFRHTNRKIGRRKDLQMKVPDNDAFEEPANFEEESQGKKERYWTEVKAQRVFTIFTDMAEGNPKFSCSIEELTEAYNENYPTEEEADRMKKTAMQKVMAELEKDVIFVKCNMDGTTYWSAKYLPQITILINENIEDVPDDTDEVVA